MRRAFFYRREATAAILPRFIRDPVKMQPRSPPQIAICFDGDDAMIKTAIVAMTVMGCDCDAKLCEYIAETPAQWATIDECEAAMKSQIIKQQSFDYPLISGICRTVSQPVARMVSAPVSNDGAKNLAAFPAASESAAESAHFYDGMVEGSRIVFRKTASGYQLAKSGFGRAADRMMDFFRQSANIVLRQG